MVNSHKKALRYLNVGGVQFRKQVIIHIPARSPIYSRARAALSIVRPRVAWSTGINAPL